MIATYRKAGSKMSQKVPESNIDPEHFLNDLVMINTALIV